jgi:hypothetical protein
MDTQQALNCTHLLLLACMDQPAAGLDVKIWRGLCGIEDDGQEGVGVGQGDQLICPGVRGYIPKLKELRLCDCACLCEGG